MCIIYIYILLSYYCHITYIFHCLSNVVKISMTSRLTPTNCHLDSTRAPYWYYLVLSNVSLEHARETFGRCEKETDLLLSSAAGFSTEFALKLLAPLYGGLLFLGMYRDCQSVDESDQLSKLCVFLSKTQMRWLTISHNDPGIGWANVARG